MVVSPSSSVRVGDGPADERVPRDLDLREQALIDQGVQPLVRRDVLGRHDDGGELHRPVPPLPSPLACTGPRPQPPPTASTIAIATTRPRDLILLLLSTHPQSVSPLSAGPLAGFSAFRAQSCSGQLPNGRSQSLTARRPKSAPPPGSLPPNRASTVWTFRQTPLELFGGTPQGPPSDVVPGEPDVVPGVPDPVHDVRGRDRTCSAC